MPTSTASTFQIDDVFHALSDPTRRAIVERLSSSPASVSELAAPFRMSLPAIHQHLQVLRNAGLVHTVKTGRIRTCRLGVATLLEAESWLSARCAMWKRRFDALADHLARDEQRGRARRRQ
jgi:DNA-binding transcriptional ArsR family regulator